MNIEFKDNEDFDKFKTVNELMTYWYKELHKKPPTLDEFKQNIKVKQIKAKTKWYHRLVPNIIWNKCMIVSINNYDNCYVTGVDLGFGVDSSVECGFKVEDPDEV